MAEALEKLSTKNKQRMRLIQKIKVEKKKKKLQTFDLSYFIAKNYFYDGYLIFQTVFKY